MNVEVVDERRAIAEYCAARTDGEVGTSDKRALKAKGPYAQHLFFIPVFQLKTLQVPSSAMMQDLQLGEVEEEHRLGYAQVAIVNQKTRLLLDHLLSKTTT